MNKLLLATLAIATFAIPTQAAVLLPNLFAKEYCTMRDLGLSEKDAMKVAAEAAMIDGEATKVTFNGVLVDADVLQSLEAVRNRCPQHM
jgi:translation initiation factor IF-2